MMRSNYARLATAATFGASLLCSVPAAAQDATSTYLDLSAGVGYATNPFLDFSGDGSAFGRVSAYAAHSRRGERSAINLAGFVENSTYFNDYGSKQIFDLSAGAQYQTSERVSIFGNVGFSGDLAGQLSNRFVSVPPGPAIPDPAAPPPPPGTINDPDLFSFQGRQYRLSGQLGASFKASERSTISVSGGVQRIIFTDDFVDDYTVFFASGGYDRILSERSTVGFRLGLTRSEYAGGDRSTVINPQVTFWRRLSENLEATGAIGVSFSRQKRDGFTDSSTDLSLDGSLCRTTEFERLCGRVSRYSNTASQVGLVTTTSAGVDWFRRLDEAQTIQLSASVVRYAGDEVLDVDSDAIHYRIAGSYDRKLNDRFSVGLNGGYRSLSYDGPDPDADLSLSVYARYRIGDLR